MNGVMKFGKTDKFKERERERERERNSNFSRKRDVARVSW